MDAKARTAMIAMSPHSRGGARSLVFLAALLSAGLARGEPLKTPHVEAELVSDVRTIRPGQPFWVALRLDMVPEWHTYWMNPGDSGLPTKLDWKLPDGFEAGAIQWPYPKRIPTGTLVSYGHEGHLLLLSQITPPSRLEPGTVTVAAHARWLVCKELCLPESGDLEIELPVRDAPPEPDDRWVEAFSDTRAKLPISATDWTFEGWQGDEVIVVRARPPTWFTGKIEAASFFPEGPRQVDYAAAQEWRETDDGRYLLRLRRARSAPPDPMRLAGVLVGSDGWRGAGSEVALSLDVTLAPARDAPVSFVLDPTEPPQLATVGHIPAVDAQAAPRSPVSRGLAAYMLLAFAGGIILNLMPCVFPVLSIKVLSFVFHAQQEDSRPWKHGLSFAGGVLASFWAIAGLLIALRAGGSEIGWGFQLQSPKVLVWLVALFVLLALNLFGVFEVGETWGRIQQRTSDAHGLVASFLSGCLATVVATPCTAPFMGAALGFAMTQSTPTAMLVFTSLGLGMASPYVVLSMSPRLLNLVPKPGVWMESLKQGMGFLFLATVVWLVWVLQDQVGGEALIPVLGAMWLVALGAWVLGRWGSLVSELPTRVVARAVAVALMVGGLAVGLDKVEAAEMPAARSASPGGWSVFSPDAVESLRREGRPVFIDFTAKWCLSCQVNKQVALHSARVGERFDELQVTRMVADWTNRDPVITAALASYGRSGVPLYVLYGSEPGAPPQILPEVLTPGIVIDALDRMH